MKKLFLFFIMIGLFFSLMGCTVGPDFTFKEDFQLEYIIGSEKPNFKYAVSVTDTVDGVIPIEAVEIDDSRVNMDKEGTHRVYYKATNSLGETSKYILRIKVIDPLKIIDKEQNQLIFDELISKFAPYQSQLNESFNYSLLMSVVAKVDEEEMINETNKMEMVLDYQESYYETRETINELEENINVYRVEDDHLYYYEINPMGDYFNVKLADLGPLDGEPFDVYQIELPIDVIFTSDLKYEKIGDDHYLVRCYSDNYRIDTFGEKNIFSFLTLERQVVTIDISFGDNGFILDVESVIERTFEEQNGRMSINFTYTFDHFNDITKIDFSDPIYRFEDLS